MNEGKLRFIMGQLGVEILHVNDKGWMVARCPLAPYTHDRAIDRTPSFNVRASENKLSGFHCFQCGESGRISKLINKLGHYREEDYAHLALLAEMAETPEHFGEFEEDERVVEEPELDKLVYLTMYPLPYEEREAREYLERRGIGRDTARLLELRYDPEKRRILFPVFDWQHGLKGFSGRTIIPDERRPKHVPKVKDYVGMKKERVVLGEHLIQTEHPLLVVEGLFAYAHVVEVGAREFCNPVATLGSAMSRTQRNLIVAWDRPVIMLYDDDAAGDKGLFGNLDRAAGKHEGGGAIDLLKMHVPVGVGMFPKRTGDPDDLTTGELRRIVTRGTEWK